MISVAKWLEAVLPDLINAGLDLLIDGECGLWQLSRSGARYRAGLALQAAGWDGARMT